MNVPRRIAPLTRRLLTRSTSGFHRLDRLLNRLRFDFFECSTLNSVHIGAYSAFHSPVRVAGGAGGLWVGDGNHFGFPMAPKLGRGTLLIQPRDREAQIIIGNGNMFNNNVTLCGNKLIRIGDNCQIGDQVAVYDCDFHEIAPQTRNRGCGPTAPVNIGSNVWLGSRVMVLKGVTIGDNSVIGAMSVVVGSIPPDCVAAGVPARVIRGMAEPRLGRRSS